MTRAYNTATTQQNTGGAVAGVTAGKNYIINGNFDIWQRGTSGFSTQSVYTADRWYNYQSSNITGSRQSTTPPYGSQYVFRMTATSTGGYYLPMQFLETSTVAGLWGKTVTFSLKMRRSSTFDAGVFIAIQKTATVDGGSSATWTTLAQTDVLYTGISSGTTATDWTTVSVTTTIPADGTANGLGVRFGYNTNPANSSYIEIAQAQLEVGSVATPFSRAGGTIQGELAACQRYYEKSFTQATTPGNNVQTVSSPIGTCYSGSNGVRTQMIYFRVTKRIAPAVTLYRSQDGATDGSWATFNNGWTSATSTATNNISQDGFGCDLTRTGAFTTFYTYIVSGEWIASAEL